MDKIILIITDCPITPLELPLESNIDSHEKINVGIKSNSSDEIIIKVIDAKIARSVAGLARNEVRRFNLSMRERYTHMLMNPIAAESKLS
ncbi:TPA: hypothetical protein ACPY0B_002789 [Citrobacter farmeri]